MQSAPLEAPQGDEPATITLKLGMASVDVEYEIVCGVVYVQGATVNDEWADIDCFSQSVKSRWDLDIRRAMGADS